MNIAARVLFIVLAPLALAAGIGYFVYHTQNGPHGELAREQARHANGVAQREVARLQAEIDALRQRNAGLQPGTVNLDLLEERARSELGLIGRNEVILMDQQ